MDVSLSRDTPHFGGWGWGSLACEAVLGTWGCWGDAKIFVLPLTLRAILGGPGLGSANPSCFPLVHFGFSLPLLSLSFVRSYGKMKPKDVV